MSGYTRQQVAQQAGVDPDYVDRLVELGILTPDGGEEFSPGDVLRARWVQSLERAGVPLEGMAAAVRDGTLSFTFMDAPAFDRFAGLWRWLAACLVGFPLLFIIFAGTGIHPGPSGTTQDQIRLVAAAEGRWRLVHLVLAAASLLGIGAVVTLWMMAVRGRSGILAWVGDLGLVFGVAGAALLSGVVLMEAGLVAPLAVACAQSPACLGPGGAGVAEAIASLGWSNVDPLTWAGGPLATGLLLLGLVGGLLRTLRVWEAALLVLAAIGLLFTNPGLHAPAHYPLLFVFVVFGSLALRWLTGGVATAGRSPAARGASAAPG